VIASFVRGLPVGDQAVASKVHGVGCLRNNQGRVPGLGGRRLDEVTLDYLFLHASVVQMRPWLPAEPVLAAWGTTIGGKPSFIGWWQAPTSPSTQNFLASLRERGLTSSLLGISDGAAARSARSSRSTTRRCVKRCLVHRARNILAKVPVGM
jgi:putative transposase